MTDWGTEEEGWYIDNIALDGEVVDNVDEPGIFMAPPKPNTDFIVTLIRVDIVDEVEVYSDILTLTLDGATETTLEALELDTYVLGDSVLMIVSCTEGFFYHIFLFGITHIFEEQIEHTEA